MAGYSKKSLADKLGMKSDMSIVPLNAPKDYSSWLGILAPRFQKPRAGRADFVHLFATSLVQLDEYMPIARKAIKADGMIWVSWHKKSSGVPTDVTENLVRDRALATDLVDIKVCAVTEEWSGLKLVVRRQLR